MRLDKLFIVLNLFEVSSEVKGKNRFVFAPGFTC